MKKLILIALIILLAIICFSCNKQSFYDEKCKYIMDISIDEDITSKQTVIIKNTFKDGLDKLKFHLYPNAYRKDAENKAYTKELIKYGGIEIMDLKANGKDAYYSLNADKNIMTIRLSKQKLYDEIKIYIEYKLVMPECNLRLGKYDDVYNLGNFYPILAYYDNDKWREDAFTRVGDPFLSATGDYEVKISTPMDMVVACTGDIINSQVEHGIKTINVQAYNVRDFAIVASNKFSVMTKMSRKTMVYYYYFADANPRETLYLAENALSVFSKSFGRYPYNSYRVVEVPFAYGGMEYPMLAYISSNVHGEERDDVIIHETAHQWWSLIIGSDSINESYIDEGLATFSTSFYHLLNKDEKKFKNKQAEYNKNYLTFLQLRKASDAEYVPRMNKSLYEFSLDEYSAICYYKASAMFMNVYELIGRRKFEKSLKLFHEQNKYRVASKEDLFSAFNKTAGMDIARIFQSWINGTAQTFNLA